MERAGRAGVGSRPLLSLFWRVGSLNALVFTVGGALLIVTPATVSSPAALSEALILAAGAVFLLLLNLVVLRPGFAPLERLVELMRRIDPARPGQRLAVSGPPEVAAVVASFNAMLDRLERERRESGTLALRAQEDERARVARELHDEIGQSLTAVLLAVAGAAERSPPEVRAQLACALELARTSLQDVREIAQRLRPETLDDLGLARAVTALCRRVAEGDGLTLERRIDLDLPRLAPERELVVYRVAQESLTNVVPQIAEALVISVKTVESHRANILEKLGMRDRVELTRYAIRRGLVEP